MPNDELNQCAVVVVVLVADGISEHSNIFLSLSLILLFPLLLTPPCSLVTVTH